MNIVLDELWDVFLIMLEVEIRNCLGVFFFLGDDVKKLVLMLLGGE